MIRGASFRPIDVWPGPPIRREIPYSPFAAAWSSTCDLLDRELTHTRGNSMTGISEAWESLETAMMGETEPDYDTDPEPLGVTDLDRANRMLVRLARIDREQANVVEVAAAQVSQVNDWLTGQTERLAARRKWCAGVLEGFHRAVLAAEPSRKTIELPAGVLKARQGRAKWDADDAMVVEWAVTNDHPELIRTVPARVELDRNAMKKSLVLSDFKGKPVAFGVDPKTGERVPGVTVEPGEPEFSAIPRTEYPA